MKILCRFRVGRLALHLPRALFAQSALELFYRGFWLLLEDVGRSFFQFVILAENAILHFGENKEVT